MGTKAIILPSLDKIIGATEKDAINNIKKFVEDCEKLSGLVGIRWCRMPENDKDGNFCLDGRFFFHLIYKDVLHYVYMPGLPLEKVRYINSETQNIRDFPQLFINGGSWAWCYALLRKEDWMPADIRERVDKYEDDGEPEEEKIMISNRYIIHGLTDISIKVDKVSTKLNALYDLIEYNELTRT